MEKEKRKQWRWSTATRHEENWDRKRQQQRQAVGRRSGGINKQRYLELLQGVDSHMCRGRGRFVLSRSFEVQTSFTTQSFCVTVTEKSEK